MQENPQKPGFVCVEYPGVVKNVTKAIETLGGTESLSEVFCEPLRPLQLHFRPQDRFSKSVTANRKKSTSFLMSIKVKKKSQRVVSFNIVDFVTEDFLFSAFCDFQYLALEDGRNVYDQAIPTKLDTRWFFGEGPLILAPAWFSRSDSILHYHYGREKDKGDEQSTGVITTSRRKRFGLAKFLSYEDGDVPNEPLPRPMHLSMQEKAGDVEKLRKLFEERPILSRCAIAALTGICEKQLKFTVPHIAYHFQNGPWRAMWVRFGFDPRKDSSARIYQTLDFRINREETAIDTKRQSRVRKPHQLRQTTKSSKDEIKPIDAHIIKPGKLPPSRQFFYQYCDVQLPEVQAMLAAVEPRWECHPTDGWFPEGTSFACRRTIKQYIFDTIKQRNEDFPDLSDFSDLSEGEISSESDN